MRIVVAALNSLHRLRHPATRNVSVGEGSRVDRKSTRLNSSH